MRWRRRKDREEDLDRELRSDLELEALEQEEKGLSPEEARYAAVSALGNTGLIKEEVRDAWAWGWFERLKQDAVYALRAFGRAPGFTSVVILTLALGIGATTAVFSLVHAILIDPLPYPNQDRLVMVFEEFINRPNQAPFADTYHDFENWKRGSQSFDRLSTATWTSGPQILTGAGPARDILAMPVGLDFFPMLGISPEVGRTFEEDDLKAGCRVVLKDSFWKETFGGGKSAIGRHVEINNDACTVVGVMPPRFTFYPDAADMWMLITPNSPIARNPYAAIVVFGLLKRGVSIAQAQKELEALYKNSPRSGPIGQQIKPGVYPLAEQFARLTGPTLRFSVIVLFGAVSLVLLIACLNVANLLLGKSVSRQKEVALRAALGSSRPRIVRQLLTEALILSVTGAGIGVLLAIAAVHYFRALNPIPMPPGNPVNVNLSVLGFTTLLVVGTTLLVGLIPALKASGIDLMEGLRVSSQAASGTHGTSKLRKGLVMAEVALSLALSVAAGLLLQSVQRLASVPLGFQTEQVGTMQIILPRWIYSTNEQRAAFFRAALNQPVVASRGVSSAFASWLPPEGTGGDAVVIEGQPDDGPGGVVPDVLQVSISPAYFTVMGEPLKLGRVFDDTDGEKSQAVAVVNDAFMRKYLPQENPIGRRIRIVGRPGSDAPWLTIVGVVSNEKRQNFFNPMNWEEPPTVFCPVIQEPPGRVFFVFHADSNETVLATSMQKQIRALDNNVAVGRIERMNERMSRALSYPQFRAIILTAFAGVAVFLAAIGLYAVLSQLIAQRTREFGVRMALGARRHDLLRLVLWEGMVLTVVGLAGGVMITLSVAGLLRSLVYGLKTNDPWTLSMGSLLLLLVAFLAMYLPAARASRIDPKAALQYE
jgi:predicted permease